MLTRNFSLVCCLALLALGSWADEAAVATPVYGMTPKRLVASIGALIALLSIVIGGWALTRSGKRPGSTVAMAAGIVGILLGGFILTTADGGLGTGNGIAGGVVALVLGLIGLVLGALARSRSTD